MRFLFWNTNKNKDINEYIVDIVSQYKIDFIILAEYESCYNELLDELRNINILFSRYNTAGCKRLVVFGNDSRVESSYQNKYASVQIINNKYIICSLHLPSNLFSNTDERSAIIREIISEIVDVERKKKTNNTVVVGDFNDSPYDKTCISGDTLHGLPVMDDAKRLSRIVNGTEYRMFYNPMWNFLGDNEYPPGTYYRNSSDLIEPFWYLYDQVLLRPHLKDSFIDNSLKIVFETNSYLLIDNNKHPNKHISDHLPIIFEIEMIE